jgi:hypothetical protein
MYRKSLDAVAVPVILLTVLRIVLKVFFLDRDTGFYEGAPLPKFAFAVLLLLSLAACLLFTMRERDPGMAGLRGNRLLEAAGLLFGVALIGVSVLRLVAILKEPAPANEVNVLPVFLREIEHLLGIVSGVVLLWLAVSTASGAARDEKNGIAALIPVLWQALYLIDRFISFRQVSTVSDQLLETMFWLCGLLLWLAHARCMADCEPSRRRIVLLSSFALLFGVPLGVAQAVALVALGDVSGPGVGDVVLILASCLYFAALLCAALHSPAISPETPSSSEFDAES